MRIILGMSGGVDSSVAAWILKKQGHEVVGVFMKNWDEKDENGICTAQKDFKDVQAVCEKLGILYFDVNFEKEYKEHVFSYFLNELEKGRTPNPDIVCNNEIKFRAFLDHAAEFDADYIATGHFAKVEHTRNQHLLEKGIDNNKDQSYFLSGLNQEQLSKVLFPLGDMTKSEVREIAKDLGLANASKKDSTGICFIGERDFNNFLSTYLKNEPGPIRNVDNGDQLARHNGLFYYTIGQRKGLGIGGNGINAPWFVGNKDRQHQTLWVAQGRDNPARYSYGLITEDYHWIYEKPEFPLRCTAKFRYRQPDRDVMVYLRNENQLLVVIDSPEKGITPGQTAVFYKGNICLGNATIQQEIKQKIIPQEYIQQN